MNFIIIFILSTCGATWALNRSKLFKPLRELISIWHSKKPNTLSWFLDSIFSCGGCMGFWTGIVIYVGFFQVIGSFIFLFGLIGSITSVVTLCLIQYLERK